MAQNLQIDPTIQDYVVVNGSPVPSDRVLESCYYALLIPEGKWLYGAVGQGSQINTLENQKRTGVIDQNFSAYATDAIQRQVINTGKATAVSVANVEATRTGSSNQIQVVPAAAQLSTQLNFVSV